MIDAETRWEQARWLLHDHTVKPEHRLAGLLVLLYAQWPAAISRLTVDHINVVADEIGIRLGEQPIVLPERSPRSPATSSPAYSAFTSASRRLATRQQRRLDSLCCRSQPTFLRSRRERVDPEAT